MNVQLSVGLSNTGRTRPLADGRVAIDGVEAAITLMGVQALFNHQLATHEFDVCEFPLATYLRSLEQPDQPYLAIPVFPSRHFRFSCTFVSEASGVKSPAELAGKRIGVSVFDMAAAVWLRGIYQDYYGLERHSPTYVIGGLEEPRNGDEHPQFYPEGFNFEERTDKSLAELLAEGEIDALVTARAPSTWPGPGVRRLFDDVRTAERDYFHASGIFPAMHLIAIKRSVAEAHPELPVALLRAFDEATREARADMWESAALDTILPWQFEELLETERELGTDLWSSGVAANRTMLDQIIEYTLADGLISSRPSVDDLFAGPGAEAILNS